MRLFRRRSPRSAERLLWSRDPRFIGLVHRAVGGSRLVELETGSCVIALADLLTDEVADRAAADADEPPFGLVPVDAQLPDPDRYVMALSAAVRVSGIADRIGMGQSPEVAQGKTLDYFFTLRNNHQVFFQPIVELATGAVHEYECLFRPVMPMLPQSITTIVQAAIATARSVELDAFIVAQIIERVGQIDRACADAGIPPVHVAINLTPASLLDPRFDAASIGRMVRAAGVAPGQVTLECTEQQAVPDVVPLRRQVQALRRLGFGFAVDDAGAGYASFTLVAALRPSVIKIDREIIHGIGTDQAKQALVEAFVSFSRRIDARLVAEGIETHREFDMVRNLGVELGQGYLLGRPSPEPVASATRISRRIARAAAGPAVNDALG